MLYNMLNEVAAQTFSKIITDFKELKELTDNKVKKEI